MPTDENLGFWLFNGRNGLVGAASTQVELPDGRILTVKDPDNPAVLNDDNIAYCLRTSRQARSDFNRLFPDLDDASQERLTDLILQNPWATKLIRDDRDFFDAIQHENVTEGIRTRLSTRVPQMTARDRLGSNS